MSNFVRKSRKKRKNLRGCAQILPNLRITPHKLFLDILSPLWYNIQGGKGDILDLVLARTLARNFMCLLLCDATAQPALISFVYYCVFGALAVKSETVAIGRRPKVKYI